MTQHGTRAAYIPLDQRDPAGVRAAILARSSDPGAKADDMREQVLQCREFIAAMGWPLVPDDRVFTEAKSGIRNVARPVVDAVLALAARGEIDVIVTREWERVARVSARRHQIVMTAADFGVEFRFANLAATQGRMPDTLESRITRAVLEELGQAERDKIVERLTPAKLRRHADGLPHSGPNGPLYGYAEGERRIGKHGKPMGLLTWVIDEPKTAWVRWLYDTVDALAPADVSLRGLAGELERRGVPTSTGRGRWSETQVQRILTNSKYCGQGRNLRWFVQWDREKHPRTGIVREQATVHDRMRDAEAWQNETYKIAAGAIPPIITPEQFHRVGAKLRAAAALKNKGGPRRTDAAAHSSLLDGGFVRCAECGGKMTRYWLARSTHPHYQCNRAAGVPTNPHRTHHIPAPAVDRLALCLLAKVLTDPERILQLADAAEAHLARAETDAAIAEAALAAYQRRLTELAAEQDKLLTAVAALSGVPGMTDQLTAIRARLARLDADRLAATADHDAERVPRTEERAAFLRRLFTVRDPSINLTTGELGETGEPHLEVGWSGVRLGAQGEHIHTSHLPLAQAAALLGVSEHEIEQHVPISRGALFTYTTDDGTEEHDEVADTVATAEVVHVLLQRLPHDRLRTLLDDLDVVVKVQRPWTRAQRAGRGFTPVWARVSLSVLGAVEVRMDATKALICA